MVFMVLGSVTNQEYAGWAAHLTGILFDNESHRLLPRSRRIVGALLMASPTFFPLR
jgi:hypothetical protein